MRVFIYEYTCAAAPAQPLAASLLAEGRAMLSAVAEDFRRVDGAGVVTLLGEDCTAEIGVPYRRAGAREEDVFRELAAAADYTLVIAPEFDGLLADRCRWVLEAGGRLLGPGRQAVELTADKLALSRLLERHRIPTPRCSEAAGVPDRRLRLPAVLKPRHGAGSQAVCLVRTWDELPACRERMHAEMPGAELLLQPLVAGQAASVAFLLGPRQEVALAPAAQHLSADRRFRYEGGTVPLPPELARRAVALGRRAVAAVPDLRGHVGVDLVLGAAGDGSADHVIEINPRLTTSYIGLRALCRANLAGLMLRVVRGEDVPEPTWESGPIRFRPDGTLVRAP
jgi:predicted ATP-grasp superfamily ATP-dependent carboligase